MTFELTPDESSLVNNSEWLLAKHRIIDKIYALFGDLNEHYNKTLTAYSDRLPAEINSISPKIYKGEKYRMLPYVMMDQPRLFKQHEAFAIRSFFWWGNHFSIHLLLGGQYASQFGPRIQQRIFSGQLKEWYLGVSAEPWEHHFETDNYKTVSLIKEWPQGNYLKLGKWLPLSAWPVAKTFFEDAYLELIQSVCKE